MKFLVCLTYFLGYLILRLKNPVSKKGAGTGGRVAVCMLPGAVIVPLPGHSCMCCMRPKNEWKNNFV